LAGNKENRGGSGNNRRNQERTFNLGGVSTRGTMHGGGAPKTWWEGAPKIQGVHRKNVWGDEDTKLVLKVAENQVEILRARTATSVE
jgi:hypothetical protein